MCLAELVLVFAANESKTASTLSTSLLPRAVLYLIDERLVVAER